MDQSSSLLFLRILFASQTVLQFCISDWFSRRFANFAVAEGHRWCSVRVGIIQILTKALCDRTQLQQPGKCNGGDRRRQWEATSPAGDPALRYAELEVVHLWHSALVVRRTMWLHSVFLATPCLLILGCAPGTASFV